MPKTEQDELPGAEMPTVQWPDAVKAFGDPRNAREALSELTRERNVRRNCYPRWVKDGRLSDIDAEDRLRRIELAVALCTIVLDLASGNAVQYWKGLATPETNGKAEPF